MHQLDVEVEAHGSVVLLRAKTPEAGAWLDENCQIESWMRMGSCIAVGPRYVDAIVEGLRNDGFAVGAGTVYLRAGAVP